MREEGIRLLYIDLSSRTSQLLIRKDLMDYIGGVSLGTQLLKEYCKLRGEPLASEQPIIVTKGPMNTIFPVVTKACTMFKSPLTGELGESYGGLRLAMAMGGAGIDAIVMVGSSQTPIYIHIDGEKVHFKEASALWGLKIDETTRLLHEQKGMWGIRSIMVIGPGGERGVKYASVTVDSFRHFGRLGLGCVMGSKGLKAIVVEGKKGHPIEHKEKYRAVYQEIYHKVTETDLMEKYHGIGTSININVLNDMKALPFNNLQRNQSVHANEISGERFAKERLIKKIACSGCPIGCIHIALLRKQFGEPHEYGSSTISYDHELIYALGTMLGILDLDGVLTLIQSVEEAGLDAITTGVLLAWMTEAYDKKRLSAEETIVVPHFGEVRIYEKMISYLVTQPNIFYESAKEGTDFLSKLYGGREYAMVLGKNEVAGYHTGYGNIVGQAVGARHSHLDNAGYAVDQEMDDSQIKQMVEKLIEEEIDRNLLNSLVICLFARKIYDYPTIVQALESIGYQYNEEQLKEMAIKTFLEKNELKKQMGFSLDQIEIPERFFETEAAGKKLKREKAEEMLMIYQHEVEKLHNSYYN
ncbi:Aldehyde ferredoxin oxidoreductase [Alkaliphilus metalliredigens QYMF]|uniref:Aldehyde ferredoxin oxidoreductase n=1 Tax=Alkaliphilus metalliredigens (strain QYMF) TaxID=293826 RepID=A6TSX8_ALKMQ|nr:aldehyde ferredoxin oxidoreductase N-terminal domain-containing protein [Alkaliphilus metalliredigens]ABR49296.1 Aldehyde ferredoxin oxidoreductase [Alkaliphilus metalliredigens QYMF]